MHPYTLCLLTIGGPHAWIFAAYLRAASMFWGCFFFRHCLVLYLHKLKFCSLTLISFFQLAMWMISNMITNLSTNLSMWFSFITLSFMIFLFALSLQLPLLHNPQWTPLSSFTSSISSIFSLWIFKVCCEYIYFVWTIVDFPHWWQVTRIFV